MTDYQGYVPEGAIMQVGDYTTSPGGVYFGYLNVQTPVGGNPEATFWVLPGSSPAASGCCLGSAPVQTMSSSPYLGGYFATVQPNGVFTIDTSASGQNSGQVVQAASVGTAQGTGVSYFLQIGDNGSFSLYSGANPASVGEQVYTAPNTGHGAVTAINLTDLTYDFSKANIISETGVGLYSADFVNTTDQPEQVVAQQNISYQQTASFSYSTGESISEGISASLTVGIPGVAKDSTTISVTNTTTLTHGQANSKSSTVTLIAGARPEVPAGETYNVQITGTSESYEIPYTWSGMATYADGTTVNLDGTGEFTGGSEGNFQVTTSCILALLPATCAPGATITPALLTGVPEPSTAVLLPLGMMCVAATRRFHKRRRSRKLSAAALNVLSPTARW